MKYKLKVIVGSTRPGRKGISVVNWFFPVAETHPSFDAELLDLEVIDLPLLDEPEHPRLQKYTKEHTRRWSKLIDEADAYVLVTPEYNYGFSATLKNALDYLSKEWADKPVGIVSYGGISGGTRAAQELKLPITALGMMPLTQAVNIPFFTQFINEDGTFTPNDTTVKAAATMLDKLSDWAEALKGMREKRRS